MYSARADEKDFSIWCGRANSSRVSRVAFLGCGPKTCILCEYSQLREMVGLVLLLELFQRFQPVLVLHLIFIYLRTLPTNKSIGPLIDIHWSDNIKLNQIKSAQLVDAYCSSVVLISFIVGMQPSRSTFYNVEMALPVGGTCKWSVRV